jgi:folate-binding protein YgfZ
VTSNNIDYGIIAVKGEQAGVFLQGQLTIDVLNLPREQAQMGAHLNPQGRIISLFHIICTPEGYLLCMPPSLVPLALAALKKYAVFFKTVSIDQAFSLTLSQEKQLLSSTSHLAKIKNKVPIIYGTTSGLFLPHELELPAWEAVSFSKGCYTGQEIVARMHYKGKTKKKLLSVTIITAQPIHPGDRITVASQSDEPIGCILDVCVIMDNNYAALVVIDREAFLAAPLTLANNTNGKILLNTDS